VPSFATARMQSRPSSGVSPTRSVEQS
jgi:hypothetical protein